MQHNAPEVAAKLENAGLRIREELARTLTGLGGRVEASMRQKAPNWRTVLANSVRQEQRGPFEIMVRPHENYAVNVEDGRKPGKGLPRFFDVYEGGSSRRDSIVAWLESRLATASRATNPKWRPGRIGSKRRTAAELELRDRYMALSRHVKFRGIKPHPFVKPTADEYSQRVNDELVAAVRRGAQAAGLRLKGGAA